jgi:hypothetical protein
MVPAGPSLLRLSRQLATLPRTMAVTWLMMAATMSVPSLVNWPPVSV